MYIQQVRSNIFFYIERTQHQFSPLKKKHPNRFIGRFFNDSWRTL